MAAKKVEYRVYPWSSMFYLSYGTIEEAMRNFGEGDRMVVRVSGSGKRVKIFDRKGN